MHESRVKRDAGPALHASSRRRNGGGIPGPHRRPVPPIPTRPRGNHDGPVRDRLLRAAVALFSTRGYAATSIREVVEAAGVTKPALYYHFQSKEGIYRAILQDVQRTVEATVAATQGDSGTVRARVERLFLAVYEIFELEKAAVRFLNSVFWGPKQGVPPCDFRELERSFTKRLEALVSAGMGSGELRRADPGDVARLLASLLSHTMDMALAFPKLAPGKAGLRRALDLAFMGLAARPLHTHPENAP